MKKIIIKSSTWAGTDVEEEYTFEELGIDEEISSMDELFEKDNQSHEHLFEIALRQQHFEWNYHIEDE